MRLEPVNSLYESVLLSRLDLQERRLSSVWSRTKDTFNDTYNGIAEVSLDSVAMTVAGVVVPFVYSVLNH